MSDEKDPNTIAEALVGLVTGAGQTLAESAIRYGFAYISELVEQRTGSSAIPTSIWNAVSPIVAELAASALDGSLTDPETGRLKREVRAQFEARIVITLDDFGFLKKF